MWETTPSEVKHSFWGRCNFLLQYFREFIPEAFLTRIWKHTKLGNMVFFFHCFLATSMTNIEPKCSHRFVIVCTCCDTPRQNCGLWLYQTCPVHLTFICCPRFKWHYMGNYDGWITTRVKRPNSRVVSRDFTGWNYLHLKCHPERFVFSGEFKQIREKYNFNKWIE